MGQTIYIAGDPSPPDPTAHHQGAARRLDRLRCAQPAQVAVDTL